MNIAKAAAEVMDTGARGSHGARATLDIGVRRTPGEAEPAYLIDMYTTFPLLGAGPGSRYARSTTSAARSVALDRALP
jgi:hypothetical protein